MLGLMVLFAPLIVACSDAGDAPVEQGDVVAVADVRAGSTGTTKLTRTTVVRTKVVTKTVAKPVTRTIERSVTSTSTVTKTVTAAPRTVTVQAPATTVTEIVVQSETAAAAPQGLADTGSVYFANCAAARAAGAAPVRAGDPGYRSALDRDGDGIGCE